jgi:hypothetical protein
MPTKKRRASAPKGRLPKARNPKRLQPFRPLSLGQCWPGHWPARPGPNAGQPGAFPGSLGGTLGPPLSINQAATLIGCSPWTVRQTLIPRGLPFFRSGASGKLIFYRDQVIRWIENQQQKED